VWIELLVRRTSILKTERENRKKSMKISNRIRLEDDDEEEENDEEELLHRDLFSLSPSRCTLFSEELGRLRV
jgi:hypothetical protein